MISVEGGIELDVTPFLASLERASDATKQACAASVAQFAQMAAGLIQSSYPAAHPRGGKQHTTGQLKARVYTRSGHRNGSYSTHGMEWTVFSRSPIAWLYEHGSAERKDATRRGADRGRMPASHLFGGVMSSARRQLHVVVQDILNQDRQV